ncbi:MAG: hypothetical protein ACNA8S_15815 [Deferrisomatales bacterium]
MSEQEAATPSPLGAEIYDRYTGTSCPDCGSVDVAVRSVGTWNLVNPQPTRTRYHRCRACDRRFKSIEI